MTQRTAPLNIGSLRLTGRHLTLLGVVVALVVGLNAGLIAGVLVLSVWWGVQYREQLAEWGLARLLSPWTWLQNPALVIGAVVVLLLLIATAYPAALAPRDPEEAGAFLLEVDGKLYAAPFPPNRFYPLGSDYQARDLLSRVIHGTRRTLGIALTVTVLRVIIGSLFGVLGGWVGGRTGRIAMAISTISATFPSLLFALLVIVSIGPGTGFLVFVLGLGLTGWAPWAQTIAGEIRRIKTMGFMDAAEAIGTPPLTRLLRHVLPNTLSLVLPNTAQEVSAAMLILGELGFLGIFFGTAVRIDFRELLDRTFVPQTMEWGAMLAGTRLEVFNWYWLPLAPALAFFISILGFNLLADGMRQALDARQDNRLKATVRRRLGLRSLNPARLADLPREARTARRTQRATRSAARSRLWPVAAVALVVVAVLAYVLLVQPAQAAQQRRAEAATLLVAAQEALAAGDYDTAEQNFAAALERVPDDAEALAGQAAVATARDLIPLYDQARQQMAARQWAEALALLQGIAERAPDFRDVNALISQASVAAQLSGLLAEAQAAYDAGNWPTAIAAFEAIRDESLLYERTLVEEYLFNSYMRQAAILIDTPDLAAETARDASTLLDRAARLRPTDGQSTALRSVIRAYRSGLNFVSRERWRQAAGQFDIVWTQQPDFAQGSVGPMLVDAYLRAAGEVIAAGDDALAQDYFQHAIGIAVDIGPSVASDAVRAQIAFAQTALETGDAEAARARYETVVDALQGRPDAGALLASAGLPRTVVELRLQIAEDAAARQQWALAAVMYREALVSGPLAPARQAPAEARTLLGIGDDAAAAGDSPSAAEAYRRAWALLRPEGEAVPAPDTGAEAERYVVQTGETLAEIADRFGTTVEAIAALNGIDDPSQLVAGQSLRLPSAPAP